MIDRLSIAGFQSIRSLSGFPLGDLNILIGPNGAGKSNFVTFFRMMDALAAGRLQVWVRKQGGAERLLHYGIKTTDRLEAVIEADGQGYRFSLEPTVDGGLVFVDEQVLADGQWSRLGGGHLETKLTDSFVAGWRVYHFHDTSDTAGVKRAGPLHDDGYLRSDAENLAAFLYRLRQHTPATYNQIRQTMRLVVPFFDDFVLEPESLTGGERQIRLLWRQIHSDYALWPSQLSDGSIRFLCLTTVLMQPEPPPTIIIDEPELGLHPRAITLIGAMLRSASTRGQVIVSTQSVPLLNEFDLADLIIVERQQGESVFRRVNNGDFDDWLADYSIGELWQKNVLGGR